MFTSIASSHHLARSRGWTPTMIQTGTRKLIGSCFCLVGFDRNHVDFYFLSCICKRFDLGLARGSLRVSQGVRSQTTCDVQASWSKLFLQAKQVKLEGKISCRMLSPFLCRNTHTHIFSYSHSSHSHTHSLSLPFSHFSHSLTLSLSHSLTQSIMNQWFDHLISDAFIHLSTMQQRIPWSWRHGLVTLTVPPIHPCMHMYVHSFAPLCALTFIHVCIHAKKEVLNHPQSQSTETYRDLQRSTEIYIQRSTVWMCTVLYYVCSYLYRVVWSCETLLFGLRNLCILCITVGDAPPARGVGQATKELHQWDHKTSQDFGLLDIN